jgi:maltooligosyltrehalose trehalohydrolase
MAEVSVWAPRAERVRVVIRDSRPGDDDQNWTRTLERSTDGWWRRDISEAIAGRDYGFLLDDDDTVLPDPRSRWQPNGVHQLSRFYVDNFGWTDTQWAGRGLPGSVIYELHIGTFTTPGTFDSAIERLEHLVDLGVTHVELLPINSFNGVWNWGYDGVLWYAAHEPYGGPDGFKRFVDACHAHGLAVVLDVVYNHLGPSGNYLPRFGPYFKTGRNTWGDLINLDGDSSGPVREYILDNALMWLSEFHVDALRLDAVHALGDESTPHLLAELSRRVEELSATVGHPLMLIAESDLNDPIMFTPRDKGGYGLDGQWDDDVHHCLHALLSGERQGYYDDFGSLAGLAKVLTHAFFHDGTYSTFRRRVHGRPIDRERTAGYRLVVCLQNHDQVGNRAVGDRLPEITSRGLLKVGAVLLLTSAFTPMLWMGEEWAASTRWPFFTSHPEPALGEATGKGRITEFAEHGWDVSQMIDPQDPDAFVSAKLSWDELASPKHAEMLAFYKKLVRLRHDNPDLADPRLDQVHVEFDSDARWLLVHRGSMLIVANLAGRTQVVPVVADELVLCTDSPVQLSSDQISLPGHSAAIVRIG